MCQGVFRLGRVSRLGNVCQSVSMCVMVCQGVARCVQAWQCVSRFHYGVLRCVNVLQGKKVPMTSKTRSKTSRFGFHLGQG